MKTLKKALLGITAAGLTGAMVLTTAFAAQAPAPAEAAAAEIEEGKTFVTADGVLSIQFPKDDDNWTPIDDPNSWFTIGDGKDLITAEHILNGAQLPKTELANDKYEEVYQMFYSTPDEVFVITGFVADKEEAAAIKEAIGSFKVLQFDTLKKAEQPTSAYAVREMNEIRYCTEKDGVNVRGGYTTDDPVIGGFHYGDQVTVTGAVTKDGFDNGWLRVNYNGQTGYTVAQYYSTTIPEAQPAPAPAPAPAEEEELINGGQIFTGEVIDNVIDMATGKYVTIQELSQGGWANVETGEIFTWETGAGDHFYGDKGTTLMFDGAYFEQYGEKDELINDGQIFTGNEMDLYNEETGEEITVKELSQGGWADEETGEIFTQEGGGGDHFYGDKGTTLVTEWYYKEYVEQ